MKNQQVGKTLLIVGIVGLAAAFFWWDATFSAYSDFDGLGYTKCLYSTGTGCAFAGALAAEDLPAYEPLLFWAALVTAGVGLVMWSSSDATDAPSETRPPPPSTPPPPPRPDGQDPTPPRPPRPDGQDPPPPGPS